MKKFLFVFLLTNLNAFSFISTENAKDSIFLKKRENQHFFKMNEVKDLGIGIFNEEITQEIAQEDASFNFRENLIFLEKKGSLISVADRGRNPSPPPPGRHGRQQPNPPVVNPLPRIPEQRQQERQQELQQRQQQWDQQQQHQSPPAA